MFPNPNSIANQTRLMMSEGDIAAENARFMSKVYMWMTIGLALSGATAFAVFSSRAVASFILGNRAVFYGLIIAELVAVITFSAMAKKASAAFATGLYLLYAFLSGLTLSVIFFVYALQSIVHVFVITGFAFAGLSAFGYLTKKDLGPIGSFCMMGLWGLIGVGLASLIFPGMMGQKGSMIYGLVGVIVFSGLTAYDTQKIKAMNIIGNEGTDEDHKEAISGALILYLDFINLFLQLLRLMGRRR